jgi:aldose sugar dehydrogenase
MRRATIAAALMLVTACSSSPSAKPTPKPSASASPSVAATATASPSAQALRDPGPLHYNQKTFAQNLTAPWAIDWTKDGAAWFTERGGSVRVIRGGQLLPNPALKLNVVSQPGCEGGLLGLAIQEPNAFLYYTYSGSGGNTNRVSRFTIQGDQLVNEQVLVDGIPGGSCYHFGGRLKIGPDGWLYFTTGEGFIASRAADPNNLSGKVLRVHTDGSGREMFAWGFRNPQGLAFDAQGHLYLSNNGPTGEFGLCCHDEVDLVQQGGFYGWPAWAAGTRTSYGQGSLPQRLGPSAESGTDTWAPSGMTLYAPSKDERPALLVTELRGQSLRRFLIDPNDPGHFTSQEIVFASGGRLRDVAAGPDGCLYVLTSNRDGRGSPTATDDRIIQLCPQ